MSKKVIKIMKNNAVEKYARKFSSGFGKKNKIKIPTIVKIIDDKFLVFIF
jgi:hypothetical protein